MVTFIKCIEFLLWINAGTATDCVLDALHEATLSLHPRVDLNSHYVVPDLEKRLIIENSPIARGRWPPYSPRSELLVLRLSVRMVVTSSQPKSNFETRFSLIPFSAI